MNEEKHLLLPMDLQFFADEPNSDEPNSGNSNESGDSSTKDPQNPKNENPDGKETGKTFTRDDVAKMVAAETKKAVAQAKSDWEKQKSYEQMTAEERVKAKEQEATDKEALAEKREKEAQARLDRLTRAESVRNDLSENGLSDYVSAAQADLLLVKDTGEDTKKAVDELKQIISKARDGIQKELLKGQTVNVATATKETDWRSNLTKNLEKK
nr:MAG TPA: Major head protein [Caudoviricetes sp.]